MRGDWAVLIGLWRGLARAPRVGLFALRTSLVARNIRKTGIANRSWWRLCLLALGQKSIHVRSALLLRHVLRHLQLVVHAPHNVPHSNRYSITPTTDTHSTTDDASPQRGSVGTRKCLHKCLAEFCTAARRRAVPPETRHSGAGSFAREAVPTRLARGASCGGFERPRRPTPGPQSGAGR